jgi:hypothetical protein
MPGRKPLLNNRRDPFTGPAVAKGQLRRRRGPGSQPPPDAADDPVRLRANEFDMAGRNRLGPLGPVPKHEQRDAKRGRFLLHPPGIAENQVGAKHCLDHLNVGAGGAKGDRRNAAEHVAHPYGQLGIGVEDELNGRQAFRCDLAKRVRHTLHSIAPILAPVTGHEQAWRRTPQSRLHRSQRTQRIDSRVSGNVDLSAGSLAPQVRGAELRWCEQELRFSIDGEPELLLRPRPASVVAAEPGLDMGDRRPRKPRSKRAAKSARRISLHDDEGR